MYSTTTNNHTTVLLKYLYTDDQWSPMNTAGKKVYDREFLMRLRDDPSSKVQPINLPRELIVLFKGMNLRSKSSRKNIRNSACDVRNGGRSKMIEITLVKDVELREAQNAWKPSRRLKEVTMSKEEQEMKMLKKEVMSILNKLTPEKFTTLISKMRALKIDTSERLQVVIDLVFERAIQEPHFSTTYALMCKELSSMDVSVGKGQNSESEVGQQNFRKLIATRCKERFYKNTVDVSAKAFGITMEERKERIRMETLGNIRFIGELFNQGMLASAIMHMCIRHLLDQPDENNLEGLCKFLTTIGKNLEPMTDLGEYFNQIQSIAKNKDKVSSRIRFMLQDVIDLRVNKWVPRRNHVIPKTMDQIKNEVETKMIEITLVKDVELRAAQNAWKPSRRLKEVTMSKEEQEMKMLKKEVMSILNKVTPEKLTTLISKMRALKIDTPERLQVVIDLVFERAIQEPHFSTTYAVMCKELSSMGVCVGKRKNSESEVGQQNLRQLIATRCKERFYKNTVDVSAKALGMTMEEKKERIRMETLGNIRFIGELFKQGMLASAIMHMCIRHLLDQLDEDNLEGLCKFLTTIGKTLEPMTDLGEYFNQIQSIAKNKDKVSSRIRFMLQDVIDLRGNKWVPRRNHVIPKTMNQIKNEADSERFGI